MEEAVIKTRRVARGRSRRKKIRDERPVKRTGEREREEYGRQSRKNTIKVRWRNKEEGSSGSSGNFRKDVRRTSEDRNW